MFQHFPATVEKIIHIKEISPHTRNDARKKIFLLFATSVTNISKQPRI